VTVQLSPAALNLLNAMCAGLILRDRRMRNGRHQNYAVGSHHVADRTAQQLIDAGFIELTGTDSITWNYWQFPLSVTDAGRAWLAAHFAPQEST